MAPPNNTEACFIKLEKAVADISSQLATLDAAWWYLRTHLSPLLCQPRSSHAPHQAVLPCTLHNKTSSTNGMDLVLIVLSDPDSSHLDNTNTETPPTKPTAPTPHTIVVCTSISSIPPLGIQQTPPIQKPGALSCVAAATTFTSCKPFIPSRPPPPPVLTTALLLQSSLAVQPFKPPSLPLLQRLVPAATAHHPTPTVSFPGPTHTSVGAGSVGPHGRHLTTEHVAFGGNLNPFLGSWCSI